MDVEALKAETIKAAWQNEIDRLNNTATPVVMPGQDPVAAWNTALVQNWLDLSPYDRLVKIREDFGLPGPHKFVYYPEYNPVTPVLDNQGRYLGLAAYEEMLFAPADWRPRNADA